MEKILKWPPRVQEVFVLANQGPTNILGRQDFYFGYFYVLDFCCVQIFRFPGSQISKFLDAGGGDGDLRTLNSPTLRGQIRRKGPLLQ